MEQLRSILRYIGVCDGNLEEGSMRCDANISIRPRGQKEFGTRAEIKNVNSFKALQRAIDYEYERQIALVENGEEVSRLTGGSQHGCCAAFESGKLGGNVIVGGVLQTGVEVAASFQVEELAHVLGGGIFEGGGLNDGNLTGFTIAGGVTSLYTTGINRGHAYHPFI